MGDIIEKYISLLDGDEYGKLIKLLSSIFVIIAPSFSFIFLFKRELFTELDIFRLIILCIIINATLFSIIYLFNSVEIYSTSTLKVKKEFETLEELENSLNETDIKLEILEKKKKNMNETKSYKVQDLKNFRRELRKLRNDNQIRKNKVSKIRKLTEEAELSNCIKRIILKTTGIVVTISAMPWITYILGLALNQRILDKNLANNCIISISILLLIGILKSIHASIKLSVYNFKSKHIKKRSS